MKTPRNSSNFFLASIAAIPTGGGSSTDHAKANLAMAAMEGIFLVFFSFLLLFLLLACRRIASQNLHIFSHCPQMFPDNPDCKKKYYKIRGTRLKKLGIIAVVPTCEP